MGALVCGRYEVIVEVVALSGPFTPHGVARGLTLTAGYDTFRHAFGSDTGSNLSAQAPHTLGPPPPDLVAFATCMHSLSEHAGVVSVQVDRQGGGEVSVLFGSGFEGEDCPQ